MKRFNAVFAFILVLLISATAWAGGLTNFGKSAVVSHLAATAHSPAATVYLALFTADPTVAGTLTNEVADANSYARTAITFGAAASRRVTQSAQVTFPQASGSWGTVTHWGIVNSATRGAGNMLAFGAFSTSFSPVAGNTPSIANTTCYVEISASSGEGFTDYFVHNILNLMFRNVAYSQPATYIALLDSTGADGDTTLTTAGKEATYTSYARVLVNKVSGASPAWEAVTNGVTQNANAVTFATVGASPSIIVGMAIVDGGTLNAGNVLAYDNDQIVDQTPNVGDTVQFAAGALDLAVN